MKNGKKLKEIALYIVQLYIVRCRNPLSPRAPRHFLNQLIHVVAQIYVAQTSVQWLCLLLPRSLSSLVSSTLQRRCLTVTKLPPFIKSSDHYSSFSGFASLRPPPPPPNPPFLPCSVSSSFSFLTDHPSLPSSLLPSSLLPRHLISYFLTMPLSFLTSLFLSFIIPPLFPHVPLFRPKHTTSAIPITLSPLLSSSTSLFYLSCSFFALFLNVHLRFLSSFVPFAWYIFFFSNFDSLTSSILNPEDLYIHVFLLAIYCVFPLSLSLSLLLFPTSLCSLSPCLCLPIYVSPPNPDAGGQTERYLWSLYM